MSRSRKGKPRCPSGHKCDWCGPKVAADRRDVRQIEPEDLETLRVEGNDLRREIESRVRQMQQPTVEQRFARMR